MTVYQELLLLDVKAELFAINITDVQEIRVLSGLRKLPDTPAHWLGVIEFREQIVPVLDLRAMMRAENIYIGDKTVVVVVQVNDDNGLSRLVGLVVDAVSNVISIDPSHIKPPPSLSAVKASILTGMFKHEGRIILMLSLSELVAAQDMEAVQSQLSAGLMRD